MQIGKKYNWKSQPERLVYIGKEGAWHQFSKVESPGVIWCEVLDTDLHLLEETARTLGEIVEAIRTDNVVTVPEMMYAVIAFDVLMSQLHVDKHFDQLQEYLKASHTPPQEYAGWVNDPVNPEAVAWYKAMLSISAGGVANDDA